MATRPTVNGNLAATMAMLVQAQAMLMQNQAHFLNQMVETRRDFAEMKKDLDTIKAVLVRHERILEELPEALRQKIGFNPNKL